jgi:hypothetical protein
MLAGPVAPVASGAPTGDSLHSLRGQFANAFTPGTIEGLDDLPGVKIADQ